MPESLKVKINCQKRVLATDNSNDVPENTQLDTNRKDSNGKRHKTISISPEMHKKRLKTENLKSPPRQSLRSEDLDENFLQLTPSSSSSNSEKANGICSNRRDSHKKNKSDNKSRFEKSHGDVSCTVSINETYQLGYAGESNDADIFLFDFVDGLEVSYPVTVDSPDVLPDHLPPLFSGVGYLDQLIELAKNALESLAIRIDQWLRACQEASDSEYIWRTVTTHNASTSLRRQIFTLLTTLVPETDVSEGFDCTSPDVDHLLYRLICQLSTATNKSQDILDADKTTPKGSIPLVSLCHEPEYCLKVLRERILTLLHIMLPQLKLPGGFNVEKDLPDLIDAVYSYNPQSQ